MDAKKWRAETVRQMKKCGTYHESFDRVIDTLAAILEQRDLTMEEFIASGRESCTVHISDRGQKNLRMNPFLKSWMELNTQALAYWRELGLTSRAYKAMSGSVNVKVESKSLEDALESLGI